MTYRVYRPRRPRVGGRAYVYYDGKVGREVEAEIVAVRGFALQLRFKAYAGDAVLTAWFVRRRPSPEDRRLRFDPGYGAYVRHPNALMPRLFRRVKGDWYSAYLYSHYKKCHGITLSESRDS